MTTLVSAVERLFHEDVDDQTNDRIIARFAERLLVSEETYFLPQQFIDRVQILKSWNNWFAFSEEFQPATGLQSYRDLFEVTDRR